MGTIDSSTHAVRLSRAECWTLLGRERVGRLAVIVDGAPVVYPVNHLTEHDAIVIRSDAGGKVAGLGDGAPVGFEIDRLDPDGRTGWSVLVKGVARPMNDPATLRLGPARAPAGDGDGPAPAGPSWIRIVAIEVTGRRVQRTAEQTAWRDDTADIVSHTTFAPEWGDDNPADNPDSTR